MSLHFQEVGKHFQLNLLSGNRRKQLCGCVFDLDIGQHGKYSSCPTLDKNGTTQIYRNKWDKYGSTHSVVRPFGSAIRSFGHSVKSGYRVAMCLRAQLLLLLSL